MFFMAGCSGYLLVAFYLVYDLQLHDTASMQQRALHMSQRGLRFFFTPGEPKEADPAAVQCHIKLNSDATR